MKTVCVTSRSHVRNIGIVCAGLMALNFASSSHAEDWLRFRGANGSGISTENVATPVKWSATENLKWKLALPGPGSSCPIVVGEQVLVTCWSGYGAGGGGSQDALRRHLISINRATGKIEWQREVQPHLPEDRYGGMFAEHGYASHTPVSDGKNVYVFMGKTGVLAYTLSGEKLWHAKVGTESDPRGWGSASSPILYKDTVIVTASAESEALVALKKSDGSVAWRIEAKGFGSTWGTPILVDVDKDRTDLVLGVPYEIWSINPDTGKLRWYCEAMDTNSYCSSVVVDEDGVVYGVEGRSGGSIAVRASGKGDITDQNVVWQGRDRGRIATPIVHDGRLYFFSSGIANCLSAKTGERIYQSRLSGGSSGGSSGGFGRGRGGQDYSSPVMADGKIYYTNRSGDTFVVKAGDKFEQLAVNRLTSEREDFSATPAISRGELFIRSSKHIYCVAVSTETAPGTGD